MVILMKNIQIRQNLALAYQIISHLKMDDSTYTHLSARSDRGDTFFIYPFGFLFEEVTPECLLEVDFDGKVLSGQEHQYNKTGYIIHASLYKARPDIHNIFHLHTPATISVSAMACGLKYISQHALHFYGNIAYHTYNSLALDPKDHAPKLVSDLGYKKIMFLENHGTLTCGATPHETFFYTYHLERACQIQCLAMQGMTKLIEVPEEVCKKSVKDLLGFEDNLGMRDWLAWTRCLQRHKKLSFDVI